MKKKSLFYLMGLLVTMLSITACGETDETTNEYPDWQSTNEAYFDSIYNEAKADTARVGSNWKIFRKWSYEESAAKHSYDHIVVKVLQKGTGSGTPLYRDTVKVHLQGRLKASVSYPKGLVFERTYTDPFNAKTASSAKRAVAGVVEGLQTALQQMRIGDRWQIFVPYQLGYNGRSATGTVLSSSQTTVSIPPYSTLVYEVTLVEFYRVGKKVPNAKAFGGW